MTLLTEYCSHYSFIKCHTHYHHKCQNNTKSGQKEKLSGRKLLKLISSYHEEARRRSTILKPIREWRDWTLAASYSSQYSKVYLTLLFWGRFAFLFYLLYLRKNIVSFHIVTPASLLYSYCKQYSRPIFTMRYFDKILHKCILSKMQSNRKHLRLKHIWVGFSSSIMNKGFWPGTWLLVYISLFYTFLLILPRANTA